MPKRSDKPTPKNNTLTRDVNAIARCIMARIEELTEELSEVVEEEAPEKDPLAERKHLAEKTAKARWGEVRVTRRTPGTSR